MVLTCNAINLSFNLIYQVISRFVSSLYTNSEKKLKNGQKTTVVLIFDFEIELLTFGFTLFEVSHSFSALTPIK